MPELTERERKTGEELATAYLLLPDYARGVIDGYMAGAADQKEQAEREMKEEQKGKGENEDKTDEDT